MLRHRFLIYHRQAHIFRKLNNGRNIDTEQLFDIFGEIILDWYPIDGRGRIINNFADNITTFSNYTGYPYVGVSVL